MKKSTTKTRLVQVLFSPFVFEKIEKASKTRGESVSELIRRAAEKEADNIPS